MEIDPKTLELGLSIGGTFLGTLSCSILGMAKWFHANLTGLRSEINNLKDSINTLDKTLAVQIALFEQWVKKG